MNVPRLIVEAALGFVLWTLFLTPYMVFVVRVDSGQYLAWLVMQAVLVPPIAVIVVRATNRATRWMT
jgi:hypothetical protein